MPRRVIVRPAPAKPPVNQERIAKLETLLEYHNERQSRWEKKLKRAFREFNDARTQIERVQKRLQQERGQ